MSENLRWIVATGNGTMASLLLAQSVQLGSLAPAWLQLLAISVAVVNVWSLIWQIVRIVEMRRDGK